MTTITVRKQTPILFRGDLVRAILEGRKTQTRRPVKPQPATEMKGGFLYPYPPHQESVHGCPYGQPGDLIWAVQIRPLESLRYRDRYGVGDDGKVYRIDGAQSRSQ